MQLFGFEFKRKENEEQKDKLVSFVPPTNDDGSLIVTEGGVYGTYVDLDGSVRTEAELVFKYRQISQDPTVDMAIQDIVNEAIVEDSSEETVSLVLDELKISDSIKKKMIEEFQEVLNLLEFSKLSYETFRRWYIDGRLYYHAIIDIEKPSQGIQEIRYIDPRHIKKIKKIQRIPFSKDSRMTVEKVVEEYYLYNKAGFLKKAGSLGSVPQSDVEGLKIAKDSIVYCTSGYLNAEDTMVLSYLHKAIRPLNQLKSMEDSMLIYRISRAPERRVFYIDVGGLPRMKAEQYLRDIMTKFKNKIVYDSSTGEIRDDRKFMTMLEDYWLPRREGGRGTEITTLPGGQNLGEIEDIVYFQNKLYRSLNVPTTRLQPETTYTLGRATEITRDEIKFAKFITRLRAKFSDLFLKLLEKQLILKGVCTPEDWDDWKNLITFKYAVDNYYEELKHMEMMRDRLGILNDVSQFTSKYFSHEYVRRYILQQSDAQMKEIDDQIKKEKSMDQYADDMGLDDEGGGGFGNQNDDDDEEDSKVKPPPPKPPEDDKEDENDEDV